MASSASVLPSLGGIVLLTAMTVLAAEAAERLYSHSLPVDDGATVLYTTALAQALRDRLGALGAVHYAAWIDRYPLHPIVSACFGAVLPHSNAMAPWLNLPWMLAAFLATSRLFARTGLSPPWAAALAIVPLLHPVLATSDHRGLVSLHPDLTAYHLGVTVLALVIASDGLRGSRREAALAGMAAGLLVVGRYPHLGLIAVMLAPWLLPRAITGGRFATVPRPRWTWFLVSFGLSCGWWLALMLRPLVESAVGWWGQPLMSIGTATPVEIPGLIRAFSLELVGGRSWYGATVLWLLGVGVAGRLREGSWDRVPWSVVWMALSPLLLLLALRTDRHQYALVSAFAVPYLGIVLWQDRTGKHACTGGWARALTTGSLLGTLIATTAVGFPTWSGPSREPFSRLLSDVVRCQGDRCDVAFTYWGDFNAPLAAEILIRDFGRLATVDGLVGTRPTPPVPVIRVDSHPAFIARSRLAEVRPRVLADYRFLVCRPPLRTGDLCASALREGFVRSATASDPRSGEQAILLARP